MLNGVATPSCPSTCGLSASTLTRTVECKTMPADTVVDVALCTNTRPLGSQDCPATIACGKLMVFDTL